MRQAQLRFLLQCCLCLVILTTTVVKCVSNNAMHLVIDGFQNRAFPNVSLGLEVTDSTSHCASSMQKKGEKYEMIYTPNRRVQSSTLIDAKDQELQLAVVLAVGGHSDSHYDYGPSGSLNGLLAVWDSWVEHFFSQTSNTTSFVMLLDERDYLKAKNISGWTKKEYMDNAVINNMGGSPVDCIHLRNRTLMRATRLPHAHHGRSLRERNKHKFASGAGGGVGGGGGGGGGGAGRISSSHRAGCSNALSSLDSGYRVYYIDVSRPGNLQQKPLIIFATVYKFTVPEWAKNEDEEILFKTWRPPKLVARYKRYPTNYAYVKMTNWYSHHMLSLRLLDFFDYGGKLDNDVSFVAPFPEANLPGRLANKNAAMLITQKQWYPDDPRISQGITPCLKSYIASEKTYCGRAETDVVVGRGMRNDTLWDPEMKTTFRAHFLVFWLGLYTAPETRRMAKYWNEWHPGGMWDYRWGDQQWWPRPLAMFGSGNLEQEIDIFDEINTDNEKYVVHKQWPRYQSIPHVRYFEDGRDGNGSFIIPGGLSVSNMAGRKRRDGLYESASKCFAKWAWRNDCPSIIT